MGSTQRITNVQTFCSNADLTKAQKPIETKVNTFLFMYMNSRDVIICYLELRKTRSVFPIPLEFEISKFACTLIESLDSKMGLGPWLQTLHLQTLHLCGKNRQTNTIPQLCLERLKTPKLWLPTLYLDHECKL